MNTPVSIVTAILTPGGLEPTPYRAESLAEAVHFEPSGVYTVGRTYRRFYVLKFDAHLNRLEESARLTGGSITLDRPALRAALRQLIEQAGYAETRFRITIPAQNPDTLYFALEPLKPVPPEARINGVRVITFAGQRDNPAAKDTRWMDRRAPFADRLAAANAYEGLLINPEGCLLEGLSSNFYAVLDGELRTAREGILYGISRSIVMTVAPEVLPLREQPVALADLPRVSEAFLTSSSRGIVPIAAIDDHLISDGRPGPLTLAIAARYDAWSEEHLEPL